KSLTCRFDLKLLTAVDLSHSYRIIIVRDGVSQDGSAGLFAEYFRSSDTAPTPGTFINGLAPKNPLQKYTGYILYDKRLTLSPNGKEHASWKKTIRLNKKTFYELTDGTQMNLGRLQCFYMSDASSATAHLRASFTLKYYDS
ncbi:hypothetical protein, partial [Anaplasma marginale]|uniref:hypothetical protein n=1 Tax=Anaplasma marginale TaxID=770 RepID=UPI0005B50612